jgi:hypothetical protein
VGAHTRHRREQPVSRPESAAWEESRAAFRAGLAAACPSLTMAQAALAGRLADEHAARLIEAYARPAPPAVRVVKAP